MTTPHRIVSVLAGAMVLASILASGPGAGAEASAAPRPYAPHTVLVAFDAGVTSAARAAVHAIHGGRVSANLGFQDVDVVTLPAGVDPRTAARAYAASPIVDFAEP